jgi:hypothetical protein
MMCDPRRASAEQARSGPTLWTLAEEPWQRKLCQRMICGRGGAPGLGQAARTEADPKTVCMQFIYPFARIPTIPVWFGCILYSCIEIAGALAAGRAELSGCAG